MLTQMLLYFRRTYHHIKLLTKTKERSSLTPGIELLIAYFLTIGIQMKVEFDESEKIGLRNDFSKITPL